MNSQVIVVGAGFAGLAATAALAKTVRGRRDITVRLFDLHPYTTMIPGLPDVAGGRYPDYYLKGGIHGQIDETVLFHQERVHAIELCRKNVVTGRASYAYDSLVFAAGSVTDFHGFNQHLESLHKLDFLEDAADMRRRFRDYVRVADAPVAVIVGGGYTGMELACNLQRLGRGRDKTARICLVEMKDEIVPFMPVNVREYMRRHAERSGIELITGESILEFDGRNVRLSDGRRIDDAFVCWTAGTRRAVERVEGRHRELKDGRMIVDSFLRIPQHPEVFVAGDAAAMRFRGRYLRKAVNFSIGSGRQAGRNAAALLCHRPQERYRPRDLGWVIPFCHVGVGRLFNRYPMHGKWPLAAYFFMCGLRNYNTVNRLFFWKQSLQTLIRPRPKNR